MKPHPIPLFRSRARRRGSVFLICLLLITALSLTASSFSLASGSSLDVARDESASLQAEFMAESGMAFALRQLILDPDWTGTGDQGISLGGGTFEADVVGAGPSGGVLMLVTGIEGESKFMLQSEIDLGSGGPSGIIKSCGLVTYGGALDTNNLEVDGGSMLVVDHEEGVLDWSGALQDWLQPPIADPDISANNVDVDGTLYTYEDPLNGITADDRVTLSSPVRTPQFDLEAFLVPNANSMILTSGTLKNITTTKTVVVNVPAGTHISIDKCDFQGGLVVYSESTYTPRGSPRNTIEWKSSNFGSATPTGVIEHIGVIAPAAHVTHSTNQTAGYGLFLVKSAGHLNNITIQAGALMILDYVDQLNNLAITYDDSIWTDEMGAYLNFGVSSTSLLTLQEYYPGN